MHELEAKILDINHEKIVKKLISLGAKKIFDGDLKTVFFDTANGSIVKSGNVLRLRKQLGKTELTYKKVNKGKSAKSAEEYSVEVSDFGNMETILESIGLKKNEYMSKHRVSFEIYGTRFDIDRYLGSYDFIPEFLEIEAENTDLIYKYAKLLGFEAKDCLPWSTDELINYYFKAKSD